MLEIIFSIIGDFEQLNAQKHHRLGVGFHKFPSNLHCAINVLTIDGHTSVKVWQD